MKHRLYIASCSFGKDSIATILLALKHNEPIDRVLFSEVMFDHDKGISGESPEHIKWIYNTAIPMLEGMGLRVDVVRSKKDYQDEFYHVRKKGKRIGKIAGFPMGGSCTINRELKVKPIHDYLKELKKDYDVIQYIGIAMDEPKRLERLHNSKDEKVSLLEKYGYTEDMAYKLCKEYGLLSPIYQSVSRGGCWFCPNANIRSYIMFRKSNPDVWCTLRDMSKNENMVSPYFKYKETFSQVEKKMDDMEYYMNNQLQLFAEV